MKMLENNLYEKDYTVNISPGPSGLSMRILDRCHINSSANENVWNYLCENDYTLSIKCHNVINVVYCATQLMLYTGDKLNRPVFCCL